mmetsp:Transcript_14928/g.40014  ORF Transcript_14928/g.40014 Transcript_14928/m.40014 type:complete len:499 (+) Transcript_14928:171-1667(+)
MRAGRVLRAVSPRLSPRLSVAIVGSGPSGCYAAAAAARTFPAASVDVLEALPTPFGLVRYGVAPDHAHAKIVSNQFSELLGRRDVGPDGVDRAPVCWLGNVQIGKAIALGELQELYDVVILAAGAERERDLDHLVSPSGSAATVLSARKIVSWYNGHPVVAPCVPKNFLQRSAGRMVIIGNGNVALDVARILLSDVDRLAATDLAPEALEELRRSPIREVIVVGRRGPAQAKWTAKEFREVATKLPGVSCSAQPDETVLTAVDEEELRDPSMRSARRCYDILKSTVLASEGLVSAKTLNFRFLLTPRIIDERGISFQRSILSGPALHQRATVCDTSELEEIETDLISYSIGYSVDIDSVGARGLLELNPTTGGIQNIDGRVAGASRLYVTGWMKRGSSGIIGTNKWCAEETLRTIAMDVGAGSLGLSLSTESLSLNRRESRQELLALLRHRGVPVVDWGGWLNIDSVEKRAGATVNRPRIKLTTVDQLLEAALHSGGC